MAVYTGNHLENSNERGAEPMKKKIWAVVVVILLVLNLYHTIQLRNEVQNSQSNILSQVISVKNDVQNISSNISYELQKQSSLITDSSWEYGKIDDETWEVPLICSITAKEYQPGVTEAVLICGGKEYPMALRNGKYEATIPVSVWKEDVVSCVQFKEDGNVRTENLNWNLSPMYEIMAEMNAHLDGRATYDEKEDHVVIKRSGMLDMEIFGKGQPVEVNELYVVAAIDGEEVQRINLKAGEAELEHFSQESDWAHYQYDFKQEYEVPYGSELEIFVEYVDKYELHYQMTVDQWAAVKDGEAEYTSEVSWYSVTRVYDEDGNLLWGIE